MASSIASALLLAACGSSTDNSAGTGTGTSAAADTAAPTETATSSAGSGMHMVSTNMLMAKQMSGMGAVVTDAKGWTLYRYDKDKASMSMCTGSCAQTWMPVVADGTPKAMGLKAKVGVITRGDGMKQVTLAGWPLYRYMGDTKVGEMNGQGKGGAWYVITPAGAKSAMASHASPSSGSNSGSNSGGSGTSATMSGMPGM
ncbi:COG4315 family predicted lipoprotein [Streptomyces sp. CA-142005]|uniref:COG4315 family predicted lipoprotein n=1 Tax=Streptomyces sp. CA-142005 TaxID=3240052 RepID=UPI003D937148